MKETSMAEELLSLKWNNHQAHFVDILTFLRDQEIFVDATLACGGKLYPAHKFVLSTCSDYFKQMFTKSPNKHPIVFMKDVTARDLEALLDFMYNGEVNVPQSSLGSLIKTAEGLQIKGLAVPDDPPVAKREKEVNRDRRDSYNSREYIRSPPSKRMRLRDRSPTRNSATNNAVISKPKSSNASSEGQPLEAALDEDSRTSVHSGVSDSNNQLQNSKSSVSQSQVNSDSTSHADPLQAQTQSEEPSPGPSGLQRSKEEEMEIKQEDVVDLGDEEEGDWPGDTEGMDGAGDGGDSSMGSDNAQGFPEVLLPHADGGLGAATGDQAMATWVSAIRTENHGEARTPDRMPDSMQDRTAKQLPHNAEFENEIGCHSYDRVPSVESSIGRLLPLSLTMGGRGSGRGRGGGPLRMVCGVCGKLSFSRYDHEKHLRSHTGEKPFSCFVCTFRTADRSNLSKHLRKLHGCSLSGRLLP